jgi:hypothetical protein
MANDAVGTNEQHPPLHPGEAVGRVRLSDEETEEAVDAAAAPDTAAEQGGWSLPAIALGIVALLIMIGALLLILWGAFRLTPT